MKKQSMRFDRHNRVFSICLVAIGLLLLGYIIYNSFELRKNTRVMSRARVDLQDYNRVHSRLKDGSDILTEAIRRYVATGNKKYRDDYFKEAFDTKNREWGLSLLNKLSSEGKATEQIKEDFQLAMKYSTELMGLEYIAMRLVTPDEEEIGRASCRERV